MSKSRRDAKTTGILLSYVLIAMNSLVGFIYTPILLKNLGTSDYALYSLATNLIGFLVFLDFGLNVGLVKYTSKYLSEKNMQDYLPNFYGMFFLVFCLVSLLIFSFGMVILYNVNNYFGTTMTFSEIQTLKTLVLIMFVTMSICFPFNLFLSIITAHEYFSFVKSVMIVRILLNTSLAIFLLYEGYGIIVLVTTTSIFNFLVVLANFLFCKIKLRVSIRFSGFDFIKLKEVSRFSLLIFTVTIFEKVIWSGSQIILGMHVDTRMLSVFSIAFLLQQIFASFSTAFSGVFLPRITNLSIQKVPSSEISSILCKTGRVQFYLIFLVISGFILFGRSFIRIWAGPEFEEAYIMTLLFFLPLSVLSIQSLGKVILTAYHQLETMSRTYFVTALLSVVAMKYLAPVYGVMGVIMGVIIPIILGPVIYMNYYYHTKQSIDMRKFWIEIIRISAVPIGLAIIAYNIVAVISITGIGELCIYIFIYMVLLFYTMWFFSFNSYEKNFVFNLVGWNNER